MWSWKHTAITLIGLGVGYSCGLLVQAYQECRAKPAAKAMNLLVRL